MAESYFRQEHDLEKRRAEADRIREKYPDRIPVRMKLRYRALSLHSIYLLVVLTIILIAFGLATALA